MTPLQTLSMRARYRKYIFLKIQMMTIIVVSIYMASALSIKIWRWILGAWWMLTFLIRMMIFFNRAMKRATSLENSEMKTIKGNLILVSLKTFSKPETILKESALNPWPCIKLKTESIARILDRLVELKLLLRQRQRHDIVAYLVSMKFKHMP